MRPSPSLRRKLPLLITTLLGIVVTVVCWSAYHQVERVLVQAGGVRLTDATRQLAEVMRTSSRRVRWDTRDLAEDPVVVAALAQPSEATHRDALGLLERTARRATQPTSYLLLSWDGDQRLVAGRVPPGVDRYASVTNAVRSLIPSTAESGVGPLIRSGRDVIYPVATLVVSPERDTLGLLIAHRQFASGAAAAQIADLIGSSAILRVGNVTGDVWSDLSSAVPAPQASLANGALTEYRAADGERYLAAATPILGTPWQVVVHSPRRVIVAPAREFLIRMSAVALLVVVLGAAGASVLSRQVTAPLSAVTDAAEAIAQGDYTRRVTTNRRDELGVLATSFNSMATQVQTATRDLQGYARDLETANGELRSSEERYRGLVEAANEGICTVDPSGVITYANARLAEMLGDAVPQLCGRSVFDYMDPQTAFESRTRFARRQRGIAEAHEVALRRRNGTTLWVNKSSSSVFDDAGNFAGALFMLSDVTERHEAQERLAQSERQFRALIENASDLIAVLDAEGVIRYVSPALERYAAPTDAAIVGAPAVTRIHPDDVPAVEAALTTLVTSRGGRVQVQYRYRFHDGSWRHLSSIGTNLLDDPAVGGIVVNSHDLTENRALEAQLLQAQKMDAVGQLAGGIAHDFNNMLTVTASYSSMLLDELPADDPTRPDLEEIRRATERAAGLTRQLLAFSRQQMLQPQVLDLNAVVRDLERMLGRVLREDVRLTTLLAPALGRVYADPGQLEQVLVNLVVNARDAMPAGGALTIETADVELDEEYCGARADVVPGSYVVVAVSDTGIGMDAGTQARIFEPFYTTKEVGKGTGLGLSTAYGIVKQSGGHIAVYSEPGLGTTMKVYLPRDRSSLASCVRSEAHQAVFHGSGTVLLVEDQAPVRVVARRILERAGFSVLEAATGTEALRQSEECARQGQAIVLLLTDMVMPEMSGRELATRFRHHHPNAATAFMSGYTEDAALRQGVFEAGAVFIEKPFTPHALTQKLREALEGSRQRSAA